MQLTVGANLFCHSQFFKFMEREKKRVFFCQDSHQSNLIVRPAQGGSNEKVHDDENCAMCPSLQLVMCKEIRSTALGRLFRCSEKTGEQGFLACSIASLGPFFFLSKTQGEMGRKRRQI